MIGSFFELISRLAKKETEYTIALVFQQIRKIVTSLFFTLLSLGFSAVGIIFLILSLFFYLSQLDRFVAPSLITGLIGIVLGAISFIIGLRSSSSIR